MSTKIRPVRQVLAAVVLFSSVFFANATWASGTGHRREYQVVDGNVFVTDFGTGAYSASDSTLAASPYNRIIDETLGQSGATAGIVSPDLVQNDEASYVDAAAVECAVSLASAGGTVDPAGSQADVWRALMLAGASKSGLGGWKESSDQPLDATTGAGLLDLATSKTILEAGRFAASDTTTVPLTGWDFNKTNSAGDQHYFFDVPTGGSVDLTAVLSWNPPATFGFESVSVASNLTDLNLRLYNCNTGTFTTASVVAESDSATGANEEIYVPGLPAGRYCLAVSAPISGLDYALAWNAPSSTIAGDQAGTLSTTLTSVTSGSTYPSGKAVFLNASVSGLAGDLARVDFYSGSERIGVAVDGATSISWVPPADGSYTIKAVAVNGAGQTFASADASITVSSTSPTNSAVAVPTTGDFFGNVYGSSSGWFALHLRGNGTGILLLYSSAQGVGLADYNLVIDSQGHFNATQVPVYSSSSAQPVLSSVSGSVSSSGVEGTVDAMGLQFSGTQAATTGSYPGLAGFYQCYLVNSTNDLAYSIVGDNGEAFVLLLTGNAVQGGAGVVNSSGTVTTGISGLNLAIDPSTGMVSGTYAETASSTVKVLGFQEGKPGNEKLANISTRGIVGVGDRSMIAGFSVSGTQPKTVLIRAIGPGLAKMVGSIPVVADPTVTLYRMANGQSTQIASCDNWDSSDSTLTQTMTEVGAFSLTGGSKDAATVVTLDPGLYTAVVGRNGGSDAMGLVEVYDADQPQAGVTPSKLVNISTRGVVAPGNDVLLAGFVVSGNVPKQFLIRGDGPLLAKLGLSGTIADPKLQLMRISSGSSTQIATNNNWGSAGDATAINAACQSVGAPVMDSGSKDSAMLIWLEPGVYTAILAPADGQSSGIGMIEVFEVKH